MATLAVRTLGDRLHIGDLEITFERTLRIPDDGNTYPLPPGLGAFPIRKVEDYAERVPKELYDRKSDGDEESGGDAADTTSPEPE